MKYILLAVILMLSGCLTGCLAADGTEYNESQVRAYCQQNPDMEGCDS